LLLYFALSLRKLCLDDFFCVCIYVRILKSLLKPIEWIIRVNDFFLFFHFNGFFSSISDTLMVDGSF